MSKTDKRLSKQSGLIAAGVIAGYSIFMAPCVVHAQEAAAPHDANGIYVQTGADQAELDKIKSIGMDFESKAQTKYLSLMEAAKEMQRLSIDPNLDEEKMLATQDKINKISAEMSNDRIKQLIACRKVLTPDQRTKLVEILKKRREANASSLTKP
jgi:Spy/CpxP family protein refolding chaperone